MHFEQQVSYLLTTVYETLKMLITLLQKLDDYIFFPVKIPILRESSEIYLKIFFTTLIVARSKTRESLGIYTDLQVNVFSEFKICIIECR